MITRDNMQALRQNERRYMIGVKNAFTAGLELAAGASTPLFSFSKPASTISHSALSAFMTKATETQTSYDL